jgi:hypothetical protein
MWPMMGICPSGNNKVVLFIFLYSKLNVYISCYNYILVSNMRLGENPNYIYGIVNNKELTNLASKISSHVIR